MSFPLLSVPCPQHTPSCAPSSRRPLSWVRTPSMCELISTWSLAVTRRLWQCPVMTSYTSRTQDMMENTIGTLPWWTHTQPSPCRQEPCPTTTGTAGARPVDYAKCKSSDDEYVFQYRAQQLLLVKLRKMALQEKDFRRKVSPLISTHGSLSVTITKLNCYISGDTQTLNVYFSPSSYM